jgi:hypothetical protein
MNSNYIRKVQKERIKAKLGKDDIGFEEMFSKDGIEVYKKVQVELFEQEFTRISCMKSKVHFFFFQKHLNLRTYSKLLPQLVQANGGDDTFDLIALTNSVCDIDESYEYKDWKRSKYLCFTRNEIFSCLKKVLQVKEVPEFCDEGFDDPTKIEVSVRIMKGLMD